MAASKQHNADLALVATLFSIYAICALLLCALNANSYRAIAATMQTDYNDRTGVLYIAEKVRQNDIGGAIRVDTFNGTDALVLTEQETGRGYETWIFVIDGKLSEEFIASGNEIILQSAQVIMPMQSMTIKNVTDNLINISLISAEGLNSSISLFGRAGGASFNTGGDATPVIPDVQISDNSASDSTSTMSSVASSDQGGN